MVFVNKQKYFSKLVCKATQTFCESITNYREIFYPFGRHLGKSKQKLQVPWIDDFVKKYRKELWQIFKKSLSLKKRFGR